MEAIDKIRTELIDKILSIKNKAFLEALDKLITSGKLESEVVELTKEQKAMLEMSENDIKSGKLISQEAIYKRNLEWLNAKKYGKTVSGETAKYYDAPKKHLYRR